MEFFDFPKGKQRSASGALMPLALLQNEHPYDAERKEKKIVEKEKRI